MIGSWRYSVGVPVWRRHHEARLILSHPLAKPLRRLRDPETIRGYGLGSLTQKEQCDFAWRSILPTASADVWVSKT
jgi:hypothetical protein